MRIFSFHVFWLEDGSWEMEVLKSVFIIFHNLNQNPIFIQRPNLPKPIGDLNWLPRLLDRIIDHWIQAKKHLRQWH